MKHCNQCDFDWEPRVIYPRTCPRCKRYDWNQQKKSTVTVPAVPASKKKPVVNHHPGCKCNLCKKGTA